GRTVQLGPRRQAFQQLFDVSRPGGRKGPARAQNRRSEARMPLMEVYQTGVSTTAEADLHALHDSLPQSVAKSTQQLALQIRQLRRPAGLGDADDEYPAREAERAGVGRQLRSHEV